MEMFSQSARRGKCCIAKNPRLVQAPAGRLHPSVATSLFPPLTKLVGYSICNGNFLLTRFAQLSFLDNYLD